MIPSDPIYTIRHAFEAEPLCSCFGLEGLMRTLPQLEPGLYMIRDGWAEVGTAGRSEDGNWWIDMLDGLKAEPGGA
jgi:hypothetical protein